MSRYIPIRAFHSYSSNRATIHCFPQLSLLYHPTCEGRPLISQPSQAVGPSNIPKPSNLIPSAQHSAFPSVDFRRDGQLRDGPSFPSDSFTPIGCSPPAQ